jgi:hypothetical protein
MIPSFEHNSSVDAAIKRYDSTRLPSGNLIKVSPHQPHHRGRSNSNYSQGNYGHRRQESLVRPHRGHRYSATRGSSGSLNHFGQPQQYQPALDNNSQTNQLVSGGSMGGGPLHASIAETEQYATLNSATPQRILASVENHTRYEKKSNDQEGHVEGSLKKKGVNKENSPIKSSAGNSMSDNRAGKKSNDSKAPGHSNNPPSKKKKNNKKGSKQNT